MKIALVVSLVTLISSSSLAVDVGTPIVPSHDGSLIDEIFQRWSIRFNKTYATAQERKMRLGIWKENHGKLDDSLNSQSLLFWEIPKFVIFISTIFDEN